MPAAAPCVLHIVPPGGGGVERCVRDLLAERSGDRVLHVTAGQWVLERPTDAPRFTPLAPDDFVRWAANHLPAPLVLHAHGTVPVVREACARLAAATGAPRLLSLHDVWFADPTLPDDERRARLDFVRSANACIAPSDFIVDRAHQVLGAAFECRAVPLGARPFAAAAAVDLPPVDGDFPVAVIGAIGAHKGLAALEALSALLPPAARIVVLGYTERQLRPGWTAEGRIRVHGMFDPDQLPALVRHYGVRLALFPPGMPESHCYALSDAWMSGMPVLAPDHGALAERVRRHGGGTLYNPQITPPDLALRLTQALPSARRTDGGLPLQPPLPTLETQMATMNALYATLPASGPARPADDSGLEALAQAHLDSAFMRREVTDLVRALDSTAATQSALQLGLAERDLALAQATAELAALRARHARLTQRLRALLGWLPAPLRERLLARGRQALDE